MPGGPPIIPMRLQPLPEFKPFEQPVIAHDKVRYVGEPIAVVLAASVAIGEDALEQIEVEIEHLPAVAGLACRGGEQEPAVRGSGHQPLAHLPCAQGRRRRGVREGAVCPARDAAHRAPLRPHHGAARRDGRMGRGEGQAHRLGRGQGAVLQPPHPRQADRAAGIADRHDRERRRRRLRRARRVLPGGFPDPVRGAPRQPPGEMDRGPPREPDGDEPRARGRGAISRSPASATAPSSACAARSTPTWAPTCAPTARSARATSCSSWPGRTACRTSSSTSHLWMTNKTPVGTYRGPGRFEFDLLHRAAARHGGGRPRHRPGRVAPPQSDRRRPSSPIRSPRCSRPTPTTSTTAATIARRSTAPQGIRLGREVEAAGQADRRPLSRTRRSASSKAARPARRKARGSRSTTTAPSRCSWARRRSGRASRRCSRRSPPTRWKFRSTASATSITARPPT